MKAAIVALCILGAAAAGVGGYFWYSSVQTAKKIEALEAENKRLEEESAKKAEEQAAAKEKEKEEETVEETGEETAPEPVEDTGTETQENTPEETVVNFQDVHISVFCRQRVQAVWVSKMDLRFGAIICTIWIIMGYQSLSFTRDIPGTIRHFIFTPMIYRHNLHIMRAVFTRREEAVIR